MLNVSVFDRTVKTCLLIGVVEKFCEDRNAWSI